jgi:hypothetical protein
MSTMLPLLAVVKAPLHARALAVPSQTAVVAVAERLIDMEPCPLTKRDTVTHIREYVSPRRRHWVVGESYMIYVQTVPMMHPLKLVPLVRRAVANLVPGDTTIPLRHPMHHPCNHQEGALAALDRVEKRRSESRI